MSKKLSVLLATTDQLASQFKNVIGETGKFFKTNQSAFRGFKKTYNVVEGMMDDPTKRGVGLVVTTVDEKLQWVQETSQAYLNALFSQEATNASGVASAHLKVGELDFGKMSTLELMRLKSVLENESFVNMYSNIPVREETKTWEQSTSEIYNGRNIFQDSILAGETKTTEKEGYILQDPNLVAGKTLEYKPQIAYKNTTVKLGEFTSQNFTGESSHRERAEKLRRLTQLKTAVLEALKEANDAEVVQSEMSADKLFNFLEKGSL